MHLYPEAWIQQFVCFSFFQLSLLLLRFACGLLLQSSPVLKALFAVGLIEFAIVLCAHSLANKSPP